MWTKDFYHIKHYWKPFWFRQKWARLDGFGIVFKVVGYPNVCHGAFEWSADYYCYKMVTPWGTLELRRQEYYA